MKRIWTENLFENYHRKVTILYCKLVAANVKPDLIIEFDPIRDGDPYILAIYNRNRQFSPTCTENVFSRGNELLFSTWQDKKLMTVFSFRYNLTLIFKWLTQKALKLRCIISSGIGSNRISHFFKVLKSLFHILTTVIMSFEIRSVD